MTIDEFRCTLQDEDPPPVSGPLRALWLDERGDWNEAHEVVQDDDSLDAAWVHAYLHRKEGDQANARYWYARAQQVYPTTSLEEEWRAIAATLLVESQR